MGEFDISIFLSIKIDKVVGYKHRPVDFAYESGRILGSDVTYEKIDWSTFLTNA